MLVIVIQSVYFFVYFQIFLILVNGNFTDFINLRYIICKITKKTNSGATYSLKNFTLFLSTFLSRLLQNVPFGKTLQIEGNGLSKFVNASICNEKLLVHAKR